MTGKSTTSIARILLIRNPNSLLNADNSKLLAKNKLLYLSNRIKSTLMGNLRAWKVVTKPTEY